jgi:hypothetical protein
LPTTIQSRPHPRAGLVIGAALLVGWLGTIGAAIATDSSADTDSRAAGANAVDTSAASAGRAATGYAAPGFERRWAVRPPP